MKKLLILSALLFISLFAFSQKQEISFDKKTGIISVDGVEYGKIHKENAPGQMGVNKNFTITNMNDEELIYMVFNTQARRDAYGRKTGETDTWYTINFLESGRHSTRQGTMNGKGAVKLVVKNELIENGKIDAEAENKFHMKY